MGNTPLNKRFPVTVQTPTAQELLDKSRGILERKHAGELRHKGATTKIKESIGEFGSRNYVERMYGREIKTEIDIPFRGSKGPQILDQVFELENGKFVVVESKYGSSRLSKTNQTIFAVDENGIANPLTKVRSIKQFSPQWFQDRIKEIRKKNHRLANKLDQAWQRGEIDALEVHVDVEGNAYKVITHSKEWNKFRIEGDLPDRGITLANRAIENRLGNAPITNLEISFNGTTQELVEPIGEVVSDLKWTGLSGGTEGVLANSVSKEAIDLAGKSLLKDLIPTIFARLISGIRLVLEILDIVSWPLLVLDIINLVTDYYREKAINKALLSGLNKDIPVAIKNGLKSNQSAIAQYYEREFRENKNTLAVFLYLSPRITIYNSGKRGDDQFKAILEINDLEKDLVSTRFIELKRENIDTISVDAYMISLRWSVEQPLFTPFDIFLAQIEFVAKRIVFEWLYSLTTSDIPRQHHGKKTIKQNPRKSTQADKDFQMVIKICANIIAALKFDAYYGYSADESEFKSDLASLERYENLQRLVKLIKKELVPKLNYLHQRQLIDTQHAYIFTNENNLIANIDEKGYLEGVSIAQFLNQVADDMGHLDSKYLKYKRFETVKIESSLPTIRTTTVFNNSIDNQAQHEFAALLRDVYEFLPSDLKPQRYEPIILPTTAGSLSLGTIDD